MRVVTGLRLGDFEGLNVGLFVGPSVTGLVEGCWDGLLVTGLRLGDFEGLDVGLLVGASVTGLAEG